MEELIKSLKYIIQYQAKLEKKTMNLSTVKGFLGELIVKRKLEEEGLDVLHKGNQSGYDLEFGNYKIDVKFSAFKNDSRDKRGNHWGWALIQGPKKKIKCTHFVCVGADEFLNPLFYYIINQDHHTLFHRGKGQFKGVQRGFIVLPNEEPDEIPSYAYIKVMADGNLKEAIINLS